MSAASSSPTPSAGVPAGRRADFSRVALSGRGRSFITVGIVSLIAGLLLGVTDLERVGALLLALPAPAWLVVRQARAGLSVNHSAGPTRADVGDEIEVKLTLANPNAISTGPLRVSEAVPGSRPLHFSVAGVRARQRRTVSYPLPRLGRGRYRLGPTAITACDPFGLVLSTSTSSDRAELVVRPKPEPLPWVTLPVAWRDGSSSVSFGIGSGGSDDASVREYRHGDDLRKIHWRSTARSGSMMVRQEERPWEGETLVLLDTRPSAFATGPAAPYRAGGSEAESAAFEWAVGAAASIAMHLAGRRRRVTAVTATSQLAGDSADSILDLLAEATLQRGASLSSLASAVRTLGRGSSVFAVLAGAGAGSAGELVNAGRIAGTSVAIVLDVATWRADTADPMAPPSGSWHETADALLSGGWRVVGVRAGDRLAELWPAALGVAAATAR